MVVGGLGLGYTAVKALEDARIAELLVVEALDTVIGWHRDELVPLGRVLNADARNRYVLGSFFDLATSPETGFDPDCDGQRVDAILLDIDHSPTEYLNSANASFLHHGESVADGAAVAAGRGVCDVVAEFAGCRV